MRPTVAVAICTYADERLPQLLAAVESVQAQSRTPDELIVVVDHNEELLACLQRLLPDVWIIPNRHGRGLSGGRNTAAESTTADVLVFLDDDARALRDWLEHLVRPLEDPRVVATGGYVEPDWESAPPSWFPSEFLWTVGCSYTGLPTTAADIRNPIGASMAMRRAAILDAGLFREDVGRIGTVPLGCEETEMALRITSGGDTIRFVPAAIVDHLVPAARATPRYFLRRCYAEGLSKAHVASLAGADRGLSSERAYVTSTLPAAVARSVGQVATGPDRAAALGRMLAVIAGFATTAAGYAIGRVRRAVTTASAPVRPAAV